MIFFKTQKLCTVNFKIKLRLFRYTYWGNFTSIVLLGC